MPTYPGREAKAHMMVSFCLNSMVSSRDWTHTAPSGGWVKEGNAVPLIKLILYSLGYIVVFIRSSRSSMVCITSPIFKSPRDNLDHALPNCSLLNTAHYSISVKPREPDYTLLNYNTFVLFLLHVKIETQTAVQNKHTG